MQLTVLSTSDIHAYFTANDYLNPDHKLKAGLSRVASVVEEERSRALDPVLYIDNGDLIQGSPLSHFYQEQGVAKKLTAGLDALEADAFSLGNHEFNYGREFLEKVMYSARFLTVCGNVLINGNPAFGPAFITKKYGHVKLGILGLVTPQVVHWEDPDHLRGLTFVSALEAAQRWVPILKEQEKCDLIILAYHGGFERNPWTGEGLEGQEGENEALALLEADLPIDLLITGHQHLLFADIINGTAVVQSGYQGEAVGKTVFDISRDENNDIVCQVASCENIMTADYEESETILDIYQKDVTYLNKQLSRVIGHSDGQYKIEDVFEAQQSNHPYIDLINHLQSESLGTDLSCTAFFNDHMTGLDQTITVGQVLLNYPYPNKICKLLLSGKELKDILEYNARYFDLTADQQLTIAEDYLRPKKQIYHYDIFSGIDYEYEIAHPRGQRLVKLLYKGEEVKDDDQLTLAVNNFRANGGGGFPHYSADKIIERQDVPISQLLLDYIKENSPLKYK